MDTSRQSRLFETLDKIVAALREKFRSGIEGALIPAINSSIKDIPGGLEFKFLQYKRVDGKKMQKPWHRKVSVVAQGVINFHLMALAGKNSVLAELRMRQEDEPETPQAVAYLFGEVRKEIARLSAPEAGVSQTISH